MKLEIILTLIVSSIALPDSELIKENTKLKISHSYEELEFDKLSENVSGSSFDTYYVREIINDKSLMDIGKEDRKFMVCKDRQEQLIYAIAYDPRINGKSLGLFMINMRTHNFYRIHIIEREERRPMNFSRIWCSFGALYGYHEDTQNIFIKTKEDKEFIVYLLKDKLDNIYLDEYEKTNLAVLTLTEYVNPFNKFSYSFTILLIMNGPLCQ
ncbi:hypothetical protein RF11_02405 [Thelohanellus kitauei]|uniref:Uncharacterized protein n=1 Tax=Thelohanellus kitauei TaxID=669202 RepID=A0A0C2JQL4_THEKT|nr:hypothetical protein RF11_02405 [Thelohanellus kitauei]